MCGLDSHAQLWEDGAFEALESDVLTIEAACAQIEMRLCTLDELDSGLCCGRGCALDDARVWSADPCTLDSEHTPIEALPLKAERLRVSVNGQQYSAPTTLFGEPKRPQNGSDFSPTLGSPGFIYYDPSALRFSAINPTRGPIAGGTPVTIIGLGFVDLGARCSFKAAINATVMATAHTRATDSHGMLRGRILVCKTPPSPTDSTGTVQIEVSLNGEMTPAATSASSVLQFTYTED